MNNYCPHCGAAVTEDQKICIECGKKLVPDAKKEGFFGYLFTTIVAVILPIIGMIIYIPLRKGRPRTARYLLIMSIIFLILWILIILFFIWFGLSILIGIFTPQTDMILFLI